MSKQRTIASSCLWCGTEVSGIELEGNCPVCLLQSARVNSSVGRAEQAKPASYFGDYELLERISEGGMGIVYKARQISLGRMVALKMIRSGLLASLSEVRQFHREAGVVAKLDHPNIVPIYEVGELEGYHFFSMKLLPVCLTERLPEFRNQQRSCARLMLAVARAVHYAHTLGVLHRDLKPSNILLDAEDRPFVSDFGLALHFRREEDSGSNWRTGGTLAFMPPELRTGTAAAPSIAADVYALGVILHQLVTGHLLPNQPDETCDATPEDHRPASFPGDPDLGAICCKCLEADPSERYGSAESLAEDLERWLGHFPVQARPSNRRERVRKWMRRHPGRALAACGTLLGLGTTFGLMTHYNARLQDQTRFAQEQEILARQAQGRAEVMRDRMELQRAEDMFQADDASRGLAHLARILRGNPSNRVAAERLLSALTYRSAALPLTPPLAHPAPARKVRFSPDGNQLLVTTSAGRVFLWELVTLQQREVPLPPGTFSLEARFSSDGRHFLTASGSRSLQLWNTETLQPQGPAMVHERDVLQAALDPTGRKVASVTAEGTGWLWPTNPPSPSGSPRVLPHSREVRSIAFDPSGERVVTTCTDGQARIWSVAGEDAVTSALEHGREVFWACFSPDGRAVLTQATDNRVRVWDARDGRLIGGPYRHFYVPLRPAFSPDGLQVFAINNTGELHCWERGNDERPYQTLRQWGGFRSCRFSPEGQRLLTGADDATARVWSLATGQPLIDPVRLESPLLDVVFDPAGIRFATACEDGTVQLWDARMGSAVPLVLPHQRKVWRAHFSPDGQRVITAATDGVARLWNVRTGAPTGIELPGDEALRRASFSPDGTRIVTVGDEPVGGLWEGGTGRHIAWLRHDIMLRSVAFSHQSDKVVTTVRDGTARIWDARDGQLLTRIAGHGGSVHAAAFSLDDRHVATASEDHTARLWDVDTGDPASGLLRHDAPVYRVIFSPAGHILATASHDGTARLWSSLNHFGPGLVLRHTDAVQAIAFDPDGARLATGSWDGTARIWNTTTGRPLCEPMRHRDWVNDVAFSPDGMRLATACADGSARLWDAATGEPLSEPMSHDDRIYSVEFSPDGRWLLTASSDQTARLWEVPPVPVPVPEFLLHLAEDVAGRRLGGPDARSDAFAAEAERGKWVTTRLAATSPLAGWLDWFFADRSTRNLSPGSRIALSHHLAWQLGHDTYEKVRGMTARDPANGPGLARISMLLSGLKWPAESSASRRADFYSALAVRWCPSEPESQRARAEWLAHVGRTDEALLALDRAIRLGPDRAPAFLQKALLLASLGQTNHALANFDLALKRARGIGNLEASPREILRHRSAFLRGIGRTEDATRDHLAMLELPPRPAEADAGSVDLSLFFNVNPDQNWETSAGYLYRNLSALPKGWQPMGGVFFDVRGLIQLHGATFQYEKKDYPLAVEGMPIGRRARRVHFLHGCSGTESGPVPIGRYRLHMGRDRVEEVPVVYGEGVAAWWHLEGVPPALTGGTPAWQLKNLEAAARGEQVTMKLYHTVWTNPHPEELIHALDMESTHTHAAPFLVAVTLE